MTRAMKRNAVYQAKLKRRKKTAHARRFDKFELPENAAAEVFLRFYDIPVIA